jgi:hypothetical protein
MRASKPFCITPQLCSFGLRSIALKWTRTTCFTSRAKCRRKCSPLQVQPLPPAPPPPFFLVFFSLLLLLFSIGFVSFLLFVDQCAVMTASVFVWDWLLTVNKAFEVPLFVEMKAAWASTIDRQLGLFARRQPIVPPSSPASTNSASSASAAAASLPHSMGAARSVISMPSPPPDSSKRHQFHDSLMPHIIWSRFLMGTFPSPPPPPPPPPLHLFSCFLLSDRFKASRNANRETVNVLAMMLHKAFAHPELVTTEPSSFGARFRLLYLGLKLVQSDTSQDLRDKELLRDRIYGCALQWFYTKPTWYGPFRLFFV